MRSSFALLERGSYVFVLSAACAVLLAGCGGASPYAWNPGPRVGEQLAALQIPGLPALRLRADQPSSGFSDAGSRQHAPAPVVIAGASQLATQPAAPAGGAPRKLTPVTGEFDGPQRFPVQLMTLKPGEERVPLLGEGRERGMVSSSFMLEREHRANFTQILCEYGPFPDGTPDWGILFWKGKRPAIAPEVVDSLNRRNPVSAGTSIDVSIQSCPRTWGQAVAIANREATPESIGANIAMEPDKTKAGSDQEDWIAKARRAGALSETEFESLLARAEAKVASFERAGREARWQAFRSEIYTGFGVDLVRLAQAAWVQGEQINATGSGRKRFDVWDNEVAGPVIHLIRRVENYRFSQEHRRMTFAEIQQGDAAIRSQSNWRVAINMAPMLDSQDYLMSLMAQKLQGQYLIRPDFLARAAKDIERDRPTGDPGRALYVYKPTEQREDWSLTPLEQAVGKATDIAGLIGTMLRTFDKVDADARESRIALWKCIRENCDQAGNRLYAYSVAQTAKDHFYFLRGYTSMQALKPLMSVMGASNIDGGIVPGCGKEVMALQGALAAAAEKRGNSTNWVGAVLEGPVYKDWKTCRDKMEYFLRPRNP